MWKYRSLTSFLPWNAAFNLQPTIQNPLSWTSTMCSRPFSAGDPWPASWPVGAIGSQPSVPPKPGAIYGKLTGTGRHTLKKDILNFFEGCGLTPEDIKVAYTRSYSPFGMILQFPTRAAYGTASRLIGVKGRYYRLMEVDRAQWSVMPSFSGKVLLASGIPRNAFVDDVERFLSGCNVDGSSIRFFTWRQGSEETVRYAIVNFLTAKDAMSALREKNRSFCLNSPVTLRLLE